MLYTVEFQKRGLPHCHTLLWVDSASRIRIAKDVDRFISAELLNPRIDPEGYNVVSELMMHVPCGAVRLKAPCMKGDKCSKKFPKKFYQKTFFDENGHVHYRRRDTSYISKGTYRIFARVSRPIGESSTAATSSRQVINEIQNYVEGRFICSHEAYWSILKFDIHCHEPAVQILAVHLEDIQRTTFRDQDKLKSVIDLPGKKSTTLTEWFAFNEANEVGRHLSYLEFPSEFVWYSNRKSWSPRKNNKSSIGRLAAACQALGLIGDDKEWEITFEEARGSATPEEPWFLFSHILLYCDGYTLYEIEIILSNCGKSLHAFGLPPPPQDLPAQLANRLLMEERNYYREELAQLKDESVPLLNDEQGQIYDLIINADTNNRILRSEGKIVLAVASSGIASLLLPSSRTAHSRFKLPLELTEESLCRITMNTQFGKLLADTDLIIWDEAPMNDRRCFEALDRSLRDIVDKPSSLFGGKSVLLGVFTLKHNMRLARPDISLEERSLVNSFASWLLDIGDGKVGEPAYEDHENTSWVQIPPAYCLPPDKQGLSKLIDFIYDQSTLHTPSATTLQQKAIVCPKNETADIINSKVLAMMHGESTIYMSQDEATPTGNDGAEIEMLYPIEHLNTFKLPGFPSHQFELKVDAPVMLLRNVNIADELCNGTRMIVRQLMTKLIEVQIITGTRVGEKVFIHRILLIHNDPNLPFVLKRKQFPIKLCYAMTINKSQGQSLNKIGVYLPHPIFGHGQLYIALSRATTPHGLKILIEPEENQPLNATKNIIGLVLLFRLTIKMELSTIAQLNPNSIKKTLEVKVYMKWVAKFPPEMTPYAYCCILLEQEGNAIQANMALKDTDYFDVKLQMGRAYRILNFSCEATSRYQQTLENATSLRFGRYTNFDNIPTTTFPHHYFRFTSYNQLESKLPRPDSTRKIQYPALTGTVSL
ncbi:DNA helicase [Tanacetum coccineum]